MSRPEPLSTADKMRIQHAFNTATAGKEKWFGLADFWEQSYSELVAAVDACDDLAHWLAFASPDAQDARADVVICREAALRLLDRLRQFRPTPRSLGYDEHKAAAMMRTLERHGRAEDQ